MTITLTKHPERLSGMGLSLNIGGSTPSSYTPYVDVQLTDESHVQDTFENNTIPGGYYSGRTDIYRVLVRSGITIGGEEVWKNCTSMHYAILNGAGTVKAHSFQACTSLTGCEISSQYTRLEGWVFSGCTSLSSITIPDSVTLIGGYSFQGCTALEEMVIGSGMTQINQQCFYGCTSLNSIVCRATTAPTLGNNVFGNVAEHGTLYIPMGSDYSTWLAALPEGWYLFEVQNNWNFEVDVIDGMGNLKTLGYHFDGGKVPDGYFSGRTDLAGAYIADVEDNYITEIGESAFEGSSVESLLAEFPETLTTIGDNAFKDCEQLQNINLPSTMETIGDGAFSGCSELSQLICAAMTAPTIGVDTFAGLAEEGELDIPQGATGYDAWLAELGEGWVVSYLEE